MGKLLDLQTKLKNINVEQLVLDILKDNEREVVEKNKEQLLQGEDAKGSFLKEYASNSYANYKQKLNPLGVTDLRLTGAFYEGFFLSANKFPAYIFSKDEKTRKLAGQYGSDIFGLTKESLGGVSKDTILPRLQEKIRQLIHL